MSPRSQRFLFAIAVVHTLLLACYTMPGRFVPERLRVVAQGYARPLFHQQWRLFAPDPPLCDCTVQVQVGDGDWRSLARPGDGYLDRRMAQGIARNVQRALADGAAPDAPTLQAMQAMVRDIGRERGGLRFRLVEHCVAGSSRPALRTERITPIQVP
jgi:hypothetical protein